MNIEINPLNQTTLLYQSDIQDPWSQRSQDARPTFIDSFHLLQLRIQDKIKCIIIFGQKQNGYNRLNIAFHSALTYAITIIIYDKFLPVLSIDQV